MEVLENSIRQQRDALTHLKWRLEQEEEEDLVNGDDARCEAARGGLRGQRGCPGSRTLAAQATGHRLRLLAATLRGLLQQECVLVAEMSRERLEAFSRGSKKASANLRNSCLCLASRESGAEWALESARFSLRSILKDLVVSAPPCDPCCPLLARLLQDIREPFAA